ncbi:DNA-binding transcription factor rap1 [Saccharomyces pastorianus]|uniref:DNA-binding protein RAP1 n=1 Tax=Saccharomyces pastorianus TaxID=27292 RepID=A0A6C1EDY1_SACPS|nr:DNA-binding transcription factor rap1 [Saccharomyces pastorianus]
MSSPDDFETAPAEFVDALDPSMVAADNDPTPISAPSDSAADVKTSQDVENTAAIEDKATETEGQVEREEKVGDTTETVLATATSAVVDAAGADIPETTTSAAADVDADVDAEADVDADAAATDEKKEQENAPPLLHMKFYLNRDADAHDSLNDVDQLARLIKANGGEVLDTRPRESKENVFIVSPYNHTNLPTVTPTYIKACCQSNSLLNMENYLVPYDNFREVVDSRLQDEPQSSGRTDSNSNDPTVPKTERVSENADNSAEESSKNKVMVDAEQQARLQEQAQLLRQHVSSSTSMRGDGNSDLVQIEQPQTDASNNNNVDDGDNDLATQDNNVQGDDEGSASFQAQRPMMSRGTLPSHNKASFTDEEDEFILDVVRKNPTRRTTHTLYDEISHYVPNHTGNSIRHRFRVYLSKRLEYVYEVDKFGKLVRDDDGNLIKTKVLPPSIKRKFSADEDYTLAIAVKKQFYRDLFQIDPDTGRSLITDEDTPTAIARRNMTMDPNHVPGNEPNFAAYRTQSRRGPIAREFFKHFAEEHATHTENAWRDRFRKFLLAYGIDDYISYYEAEKAQNREPEPMKNLTNRPKRPGVPTPGNYNSAAKRARTYGTQRNAQPTANAASANAAAAAAAAASNSYAIPENELLDEDTMNFISSLKNDLSNISNSLPFEYPHEIAEAIRSDFSNEDIYDNIDPDTISFPPKIATTDLFLPLFFHFGNTRQFMDKLHDVISGDYEPSQAEKLVQDLCDETGIRKNFSTSILTCLSGDLMVFPRYFLNMFKDNVNPPPHVPGIWTHEDDESLKSNDQEQLRKLVKKHGTGRMEMRKRFFEKDLL